jgi:hypothetical protein
VQPQDWEVLTTSASDFEVDSLNLKPELEA